MLWQELELDSTRANDELVLLQVDAALVPPHVVKAKDALRAVLLLQHCHGCRDVLVTYLHTGLLVPYLHCTQCFVLRHILCQQCQHCQHFGLSAIEINKYCQQFVNIWLRMHILTITFNSVNI